MRNIFHVQKNRIFHIYHIQISTASLVNVTKCEYKNIVDTQYVVYRAKFVNFVHSFRDLQISCCHREAVKVIHAQKHKIKLEYDPAYLYCHCKSFD